MSLLETVCPHCGKSMVFSPIDYINTEERPEMIQKVRDGEAFVSICGHCGKKSRMDYSFFVLSAVGAVPGVLCSRSGRL